MLGEGWLDWNIWLHDGAATFLLFILDVVHVVFGLGPLLLLLLLLLRGFGFRTQSGVQARNLRCVTGQRDGDWSKCN